jgi:diaminopimelate epimerase
MNFTKMQGAANDFVLIEATNMNRDWSKMAVAICNRHLGIGADSLLLLLPSEKADFQMQTFDADGSEAETCGNGIRCLARYVYEKGLISPSANEITVETKAGTGRVRLEKNGNNLLKIRANMGRPELDAEMIPLKIGPGDDIVYIKTMLCYHTTVDGIKLSLNCVSMGNPHAVHFVQQPVSDFPLSRIGPKVERLPIFPNRVNFEVARVINPDYIEARVWERGVGETLACGSGACAITVASKMLGYTGYRAEIELPGGVLDTEWNGMGEVILGGPAEIVFEGIWPE